MTLRERLLEILPGLLPSHPQDAIKGTELIARVRAVLGGEYSDHSLRSQFSFIALDPDSCLARIENGQGYYLRSGRDDSLQSIFGSGEDAEREGGSPQHRLLALLVRLYDTTGLGVFVYPAEDGDSWEHPDLVAVQWPAGHWAADGAYEMDSTDAPRHARFRAVCTVVADSAESARAGFFRALACGRWAHECELVVIPAVDAAVQAELADLAAAYGVGVRLLDVEDADAMPRADAIFRMPADQARELLAAIPQTVLSQPRPHAALDARAAESLPATAPVLAWADSCLQRGRLEPFEMRVAVN